MANNIPAMNFIDGSNKAFTAVHHNDYSFYEEFNDVIQYKPLEMLEPETRGLFASIGIEKGKPFCSRC